MFSIGTFATMGQVSVRMLRHYDAIGLLRPARVDDVTGYRLYSAEQLRRLNRLIALKDLGLSLEQVKLILDEELDDAGLRELLRRREVELRDQIAADSERLTRVQARLKLIDTESASPGPVTIRAMDPARVALAQGVAVSSSHEDVGPVVRSLFGELFRTISFETITEPTIATYRPLPDGGLAVQACVPVGPDFAHDGVEVAELPGYPTAASYLHPGVMADIGSAYQILAAWIEDTGRQTDGTAREVNLVSYPEPEESWETLVQMPVSEFEA